MVLKGAASSRSEQTFNRAWNRCPQFNMNTVTKNYWLIYAAVTYTCSLSCGVYYSESSKTTCSILIPCHVDCDDIVPLTLQGTILSKFLCKAKYSSRTVFECNANFEEQILKFNQQIGNLHVHVVYPFAVQYKCNRSIRKAVIFDKTWNVHMSFMYSILKCITVDPFARSNEYFSPQNKLKLSRFGLICTHALYLFITW